MDAYHDVMTAAIESGDMNLLPELWNLTLLASARGDGAIFRERITKKIPEIANLYHMNPVASFPKFVSQWRADMLMRKYMTETKSQKGGITKAIEELIVKDSEEGVLYLSEMRLDLDWIGFAKVAIRNDKDSLTRYFFNKFDRQNKDEQWNVYWEATDLMEVAAERGNSDLTLFFLSKLKYNQEDVVSAFLIAAKNNHKLLIRDLLREWISPITLGAVAGAAVRDDHVELAEELLAKGATKDKFFEAICEVYNTDLIKKYLQELDISWGKVKMLYMNIRNHNDYDMIDFISKERPEMLSGLFQNVNQSLNPEMYDYVERLM